MRKRDYETFLIGDYYHLEVVQGGVVIAKTNLSCF